MYTNKVLLLLLLLLLFLLFLLLFLISKFCFVVRFTLLSVWLFEDRTPPLTTVTRALKVAVV